MKTRQALPQKGFVLIEALVAIVVVMVGALGIIKLNAVLLGGTGLTKTQAEALQLAQQRIEVMRNYVLSTGCVDSTTVGTPQAAVPGTNANFRIDTVVTAGTVGSEKIIEACVAWDESNNACTAASDKRVILKTSVACSGVGTSGLVNEASSGGPAKKLKTPTGAARVGGNDQQPGTGTANVITGTDTPDGTRTYIDANGVHTLLDETGRALLTIENPDDGGFSTISGRVYIEADNSGNPIVDPQGPTTAEADDTVFVLSSDASYCARVFPTISTGTAKYRYFYYNCYVSKGWWGNVGIARLDNPNTNNRICLGDPASGLNSDTSIWSRKDQLSISRGYRGYKKISVSGSNTDPLNFETVGIGYKPANQLDGEEWVYVADHIGVSDQHDFLVTIINGNQTCEESGKMALETDQFTGNQGRFFCMSGQCPDLISTPSTPTTIIHGTITKETGAVLTAPVVGANSSCSSVTWTDNGSSYSYSCTLNWTGFSGPAWQGSISFGATGTNTVCSSGTAATVLPAGNSVAFTVNDRLASVEPNSLTFTDVPLAVTEVTIDFNAQTTACPTLGVPNTSWGNGAAPKDLVWNGITGATGYKVASCTHSSASDCAPTYQSTQTGLFIAPVFTTPTAVGPTTVCFGVVATDSSGAKNDSNISAIKCVTRTVTVKKNGTFDSTYDIR